MLLMASVLWVSVILSQRAINVSIRVVSADSWLVIDARVLLSNRKLLVGINESVLTSHLLNFSVVEVRKFVRSSDVGHLFDEALREDEIDLFERALLGLRIEEIDDWKEAGVDNSEEEVGSPLDVCNHDRRDHDDEEVEEPVAAGGYSVCTCTSPERVDLSRVEPW